MSRLAAVRKTRKKIQKLQERLDRQILLDIAQARLGDREEALERLADAIRGLGRKFWMLRWDPVFW
jgi:hypothetical protein